MILCGALQPGLRQRSLRCTRELHHVGEHIAAIGPYVEGDVHAAILARWPQDDGGPDEPDSMAVDHAGRPLAHTPAEVRSIAGRMLEDGEILAVILKGRNGDLGVQVYGPPSQELVEILETTAAAYRRAIEGH